MNNRRSQQTCKLPWNFIKLLGNPMLLIGILNLIVLDISNTFFLRAEPIEALDSDFLFIDIRPSTLPVKNAGNGVFAKFDIPANEVICEYRGVLISPDVEFRSIYDFDITTPTGQKLKLIPGNQLHICAYINDCVNIYGGVNGLFNLTELGKIQANNEQLPLYEGFSYNAQFTHTRLGKILISSTKDIKAGSEIFFPYGRNYWLYRIIFAKEYGLEF